MSKKYCIFALSAFVFMSTIFELAYCQVEKTSRIKIQEKWHKEIYFICWMVSNGSYIAINGFRNEGDPKYLWVINKDGEIIYTKEINLSSRPSLSADGRFLAYIKSSSNNEKYYLYLLNNVGDQIWEREFSEKGGAVVKFVGKDIVVCSDSNYHIIDEKGQVYLTLNLEKINLSRGDYYPYFYETLDFNGYYITEGLREVSLLNRNGKKVWSFDNFPWVVSALDSGNIITNLKLSKESSDVLVATALPNEFNNTEMSCEVYFFDKNGEKLWNRKFDNLPARGVNSPLGGINMDISENGDYAGLTIFDKSTNKDKLIVLNKKGEYIWQYQSKYITYFKILSNNILLLGDADNDKIVLFDLRNGNMLFTYNCPDEPGPWDMYLSDDGRFISYQTGFGERNNKVYFLEIINQ